MAKKKRPARQSRPAARPTVPSRADPPLPVPLADLAAGLRKAEALLDRGRWDEARATLTDLDRRFPRTEPVLALLLEAAALSGDLELHQSAAERLVALRPKDAALRLVLASSYAASTWPGLALREFRAALPGLPSGPDADQTRKAIDSLTDLLRQMAPRLGKDDAEREELAALHEQMQLALNRHDYPAVFKLGEQLLARQPSFAPALNNLGEAHWRAGHPAEAIACARRVLGFAPDNAFALASLARYLALTGKADEAREPLERLRALPDAGPLYWVKLAETFSYLGDDAAVLETWEHAEPDKKHIAPDQLGLLHHLTAVAAARTGDEKEARKHWRQALKLSPDSQDAAENLEDLKRPIGERNGPWPFGLPHWIRRELVEEMARRVEAANKGKNKRPVRDVVREFLTEHPELTAVVPMLLDRGDPKGREFVVELVGQAATPELLAALREFAFGQRGSDALRYKAAMTLLEEEVIDPGPARMWMDGEWKEILLITFEVVDEPVLMPGRTEKVQRLMEEAVHAMHDDRAAEAETKLREALTLEPGAPDLTFNLAMARESQGHREEAEALVRQAHERDPNYLFARAWLARIAAREGRTEEARELVKPLLTRRRYHPVALAAVFAAQIDVLLAEGQIDGARQWLDMWEEMLPDHPGMQEFEMRLALTALKDLASRPPRGRKRKKK